MTKSRTTSLRAIRRLLLEEWDPVGIRDEAAAQDEYDQYLPAILVLLERHVSADELARHLGDVVALEMGLVEAPERERRAAESLLNLPLG